MYTPTGHESVMNLQDYIYLGETDPYCYIHLTYDTWWFQNKNPKQHCIEEFRDRACTLIQHEVLPSETGFLEIKNQERCVGLKASKTHVLRGETGWYVIMTTVNELWTPFGRFLFVKKNDQYLQVHPEYLTTSLVLTKNKFVNAALHNGEAPWVKPKWVVMAEGRNLKELMERIILREPGETSHLHKWENGMCNTLLTTRAGNFTFYGDPAMSSFDGSSSPAVNCPRGACKCPSRPLNVLMAIHEEKALEVDKEWTWYGAIISWITGAIDTMISALVSENWQMILFATTVEFFIANYFTRNQWVSLAVAILSSYYTLKV